MPPCLPEGFDTYTLFISRGIPSINANISKPEDIAPTKQDEIPLKPILSLGMRLFLFCGIVEIIGANMVQHVADL